VRIKLLGWERKCSEGLIISVPSAVFFVLSLPFVVPIAAAVALDFVLSSVGSREFKIFF
jgi:hypothetical protein